MSTKRIAQRLTHLFDQTVTLYAWTGQNDRGEPTYDAGTPYRARVQRGSLQMLGANQSLPSVHKVIIGEAVQVDPRDLLELPEEFGVRDDEGDFATRSARIIEVNTLCDSRGPVAVMLLCGR